jgi:hypothetical protein
MILLADGNTSAKILKSNEAGLGYHTAILYLAPYKSSGIGNVCPNASAGCIASCLFTAGRGAYNNVQEARKRKTRLFYENRTEFLDTLKDDIKKFIARCVKLALKPAIRLNGTSDIPWEDFIDLEGFGEVQFYDYTKNFKRMCSFLDDKLPSNYHLTFSRSEVNENQSLVVRRTGGNVAVVFKKQLPSVWKRFSVYNGDKTDLRFLDPPGICGLTAKGKAKKDTTGFVVQPC